MVDTHWFKRQILFDCSRNEMAKQIMDEFGKPLCVHLVAKSHDTGEILGVLGVRSKRDVGAFGRWEPAVPLEYRDSGAGETLIKEAFV